MKHLLNDIRAALACLPRPSIYFVRCSAGSNSVALTFRGALSWMAIAPGAEVTVHTLGDAWVAGRIVRGAA